MEGVTTFNLHPHLPHFERLGDSMGKLDVLARQPIDPGAPPHPSPHKGDAISMPCCSGSPDIFPGHLLICDMTTWSSTAGVATACSVSGKTLHCIPRSLSEKSRILLAAWRRIGFCLLMSKRYRPWKIEEPMLLPATVQEFVDKDHLARFVLNLVVEEIDLEEIERVYRVERGQPPFDPAMMTALLLYGYCNGVYSSRRIAKACRERVDFMSIVGLDPPDFRTISEFRKRHLNALSALFGQVLRLCEQAGLVKLGHVALDGTKIKANASKHKAMSYERMGKRAEELEAEVAGWMDAAAAADAKKTPPSGATRAAKRCRPGSATRSGAPRRSAPPRPNWRPRREPPPRPSARRGPRRKRSEKPKGARNPEDPPPRPQKTPPRKRRRTSPIPKAAS